MNEIDVKKEEEKNMKFAKNTLLILICIPIIFLIYVMYFLLGTNNVNLKDIATDDKSKIIEILNLEIEVDNIEFEKLGTPKTYKDIYYKLYFSVNLEDKENIKNIKADNLEANFREINEKNNKIRYCCTIYLETGKSIEFLEKIMYKY